MKQNSGGQLDKRESMRDRVGQWLGVGIQLLRFSVLSVALLVLILLLIRVFPWTVEWEVWTVLTSVGTVGATIVALVIALRSWLGDKDSAARVVSVWVTDDYSPRDDGRSYTRTVTVHIANEGEQPVFDAHLIVKLGRDRTPVGPLSAPTPISVIPPRRELTFDISTSLLAHSNSWNPVARLYFSDPRGKRWLRDEEGVLTNISKLRSDWSESERPADEGQLGDESLLNPMAIALGFLAELAAPDMNPRDILVALAPEASGWDGVDWDNLREELDNYSPTSMVDYPAPRIARIKLSGDKSLEGHVVEGEGLKLEDYMFMTLTLVPDRGWRIFSIGDNVPPHAIDFGGTLNHEI